MYAARDGEMVQQLKTPASLTKDVGSNLSTHSFQSIIPVPEYNTLFQSLQVPNTHIVHMHTCRCSQKHIKEIKMF